MDSYCNLLIKPTVYNVIASTPAKGPKPTTITKRIAQSIDGKVLVAANNARNGAYTNLLEIFLAAKILSGNDITTPIIVPTNAISIVSSIAQNAVPQCSDSNSVISFATIPRFGNPSKNPIGSTPKS